jgi:hypothetical protein
MSIDRLPLPFAARFAEMNTNERRFNVNTFLKDFLKRVKLLQYRLFIPLTQRPDADIIRKSGR